MKMSTGCGGHHYDAATEEASRRDGWEERIWADLCEEFGEENVGECIDTLHLHDEPGYERSALVFLVRSDTRPDDVRGQAVEHDPDAAEFDGWWEVAR